MFDKLSKHVFVIFMLSCLPPCIRAGRANELQQWEFRDRHPLRAEFIKSDEQNVWLADDQLNVFKFTIDSLTRKSIEQAKNAAGLSKDVDPVPSSQPLRMPKRWALLIGVEKYDRKSRLKSLDFCCEDVEAIAAQLRRLGYPKHHIISLTTESSSDDRPTTSHINNRLDRLLKSELIGPEDHLIFFFSGHGLRLGRTSYLCPTDADLTRRKSLISVVEDVYQKLAERKMRLRLMILDACRNDATIDGESTVVEQSVELFNTPDPGSGIVVWSSCEGGSTSLEPRNLKHGVFTYYLHEALKAVRGNMADSYDLRVTPSLLHEHVVARIERSAWNQRPELQLRTVGAQPIIGFMDGPLPHSSLPPAPAIGNARLPIPDSTKDALEDFAEQIEPYSSALSRAVKYFVNGNHAAVIRELDASKLAELVRLAKDNENTLFDALPSFAYSILGTANAYERDWGVAVKALRKAKHLYPSASGERESFFLWVDLQIANCLFARGRRKWAIEEYGNVLGRCMAGDISMRVQCHVNRSLAELARGTQLLSNYEDALWDIEQAEKLVSQAGWGEPYETIPRAAVAGTKAAIKYQMATRAHPIDRSSLLSESQYANNTAITMIENSTFANTEYLAELLNTRRIIAYERGHLGVAEEAAKQAMDILETKGNPLDQIETQLRRIQVSWTRQPDSVSDDDLSEVWQKIATLQGFGEGRIAEVIADCAVARCDYEFGEEIYKRGLSRAVNGFNRISDLLPTAELDDILMPFISLVVCLNSKAESLLDAGETAWAVRYVSESLEQLEDFAKRFNTPPEVLLAVSLRAHCLACAIHARSGDVERSKEELQRVEATITRYRQLRYLVPHDFNSAWATALNELAWALTQASAADPRDALRYAIKACELDGHQTPGFLDTLGEAYLKIDQEQAKVWFEKATARQQEAVAQTERSVAVIRSLVEQGRKDLKPHLVDLEETLSFEKQSLEDMERR